MQKQLSCRQRRRVQVGGKLQEARQKEAIQKGPPRYRPVCGRCADPPSVPLTQGRLLPCPHPSRASPSWGARRRRSTSASCSLMQCSSQMSANSA